MVTNKIYKFSLGVVVLINLVFLVAYAGSIQGECLEPAMAALAASCHVQFSTHRQQREI